MEIRKIGDVVILKLTTKDLSQPQETASEVEHLLHLDGEKKLVLDLTEIDSIYSVQIGTLVTIHVLCYENVAVMKLAGANAKVRAILKMVGLETLMQFHHGTQVALQSFESSTSHPAIAARTEGQGAPPAKAGGNPRDPRMKK